MNHKSIEIGSNQTGIQNSPEMAEQMRSAVQSSKVSTDFKPEGLKEIRQDYFRESGPVGSIPMPDNLKGKVKAGGQMLMGNRPQALIDKIGERLAFERSGVRLYEALLAKCEMFEDDVPLDELKHYQREEAEHFYMLKECLETLGADPTVETPSADVSGVASEGVMKVITDPRTNLAQSFEALLIAELADNDCWELLVELADKAGQKDFAKKFQVAKDQEAEHLEGIRKIVKKLHVKEEKILQ